MCVCVCVIHTRSQTHTHTDTRARTHTRRTKQTLQVPLDTIGHDLEHHSFFPERCNVSVVTVAADKKSIRMRVWERGAGITEACGTGACATLVNAVRRGYIGKEQVSVCVCVCERERERERNTQARSRCATLSRSFPNSLLFYLSSSPLSLSTLAFLALLSSTLAWRQHEVLVCAYTHPSPLPPSLPSLLCAALSEGTCSLVRSRFRV